MPLFFFKALAGLSTLTVVVMVLPHNQSQRNVVCSISFISHGKTGRCRDKFATSPSFTTYFSLLYDFGAAAIVASNFVVSAFLAAAAFSKS